MFAIAEAPLAKVMSVFSQTGSCAFLHSSGSLRRRIWYMPRPYKGYDTVDGKILDDLIYTILPYNSYSFGLFIRSCRIPIINHIIALRKVYVLRVDLEFGTPGLGP